MASEVSVAAASGEGTRRAPFRWLRAAYDWAPGPWRPDTRLGRRLFWIVVFGYSVAAAAITLLGGDLGQTLAAGESVHAWLAAGTLPEGAPWIRENFAAIYLPLFAVAMATRFGVTFFGVLRYERDCGEPLPMKFMVTMMLANGVLFIAPLAIVTMLGLAALGLGFDFESGRQLFAAITGAVEGAIQRYVPTLITVPYPWPLLFAMVTGGFGYYWWHRFQHTWRPLWLLSHRSHHVMTYLVQIAAMPAANPLAFLANSIPLAILIGVTTKLFAAEPMLLEAMLWVLVSHTFTEVFNHTEPVYRWTMRGPVRSAWFTFWGCGAWHQVHHSSLPEHAMVNLGGGPWMVWDRVFGTYVEPPVEKPPMGLTNRPPVKWTAARVALSGHVELARELWRNRGWWTRAKILFGPTHYTPEVEVHELLDLPAAGHLRRSEPA